MQSAARRFELPLPMALVCARWVHACRPASKLRRSASWCGPLKRTLTRLISCIGKNSHLPYDTVVLHNLQPAPPKFRSRLSSLESSGGEGGVGLDIAIWPSFSSSPHQRLAPGSPRSLLLRTQMLGECCRVGGLQGVYVLGFMRPRDQPRPIQEPRTRASHRVDLI